MTEKSKEIIKKRSFRNPERKLKQLKLSVIIAIIIGVIFIASEAFNDINSSLIDYQLQQNEMDFEANLINYDEYNRRRDYLILKRYETELISSLTSNTAKISLTIVIAFTIAILILISFDDFFDKKLRRITLIIAFILLIFIFYSVFVSNLVLYFPYYY